MRVPQTPFRRDPGETAPGHVRKNGNRWLCSRGRRRAGPVPPGGNVESCPCIDHQGAGCRVGCYRGASWRAAVEEGIGC